MIDNKENVSFAGAKLKVARANQHVLDLKEIVNSWVATNPYRIIADKDTKTGTNLFGVEIFDTLPSKIPLVLGDALHNYRAALDHAVYAIGASKGATKTTLHDIQFPFASDQHSLLKTRPYAAIHKACPLASKIIAEDIHPHKRGNYTLWALNKIDVMDKHKLVIPNVSMANITITVIDRENNNRFQITTEVIGAEIRIPAEIGIDNLEVEQNSPAVFDVVFGTESFFDGRSVFEVLVEIQQIVISAIKRLEVVI